MVKSYKVLGLALIVIAGSTVGNLTAQGAAPGVTSFSAANTTAGTSLSASPKVATGAGDLLVAAIKVRSTSQVTVTMVTDSASNPWAKAVAVTQGKRADGEIWYASGAASVSNVTVTVTRASALALTVIDVTGASASPLDKTAVQSGNSTTASTGTTATTVQANEIVVADIGWNGNVTPSGQTAGYTTAAVSQSTVGSLATGEQAAWAILSATGPQTYGASLSSSTVWTGAIATFKVGASTPPPPPTITSFSPTSGQVGTSVTITGTGFTGATAVGFNGTNQSAFTVNSDTQITTTVPIGATTGAITVTTPGGTATSSTSFSVTAPPPPPTPTITGFSPTSGSVGTSVTITGTGFTGATAVGFNGTNQSAFTVNSDTQITTIVPSGATTGAITVTTPGGTATSSTAFTVTAPPPPPTPTITGFSPTSGSVGTSVTITGTGFTGATAVGFNRTNQPSFAVNSATQITAAVPSGATTGFITVTTPGGTATSSTAFTVSGVPHVMVIVEENQEYGTIIGSSLAPYINSLASTHTSATNWFGIVHGSTPDYLALISGSTWSGANFPLPASDITVVDELAAAGISWKAYMESVPSACYTGASTGDYDKNHNPFVKFNSIRNTPSQCNSVVPYSLSTLSSDLNSASPPAFTWITPNDCNNMHGAIDSSSACANFTHDQLITAGDNWLQNNLPTVLSSSWYASGGIVIITWDEGTTQNGWNGGNGGQIPTLVISSHPIGQFGTGGDHYGTLKGIEEVFGVPQLLQSSGTADGDLSKAF